MRCPLLASVILCLCHPASAGAQEKERTLCDTTDAKNKCPGPDCRCIEDTLEVTFDGNTDSILVVDDTRVGTKVVVTIMTDTKSGVIQEWSYGVAHDVSVLTINSATMNGTDAKIVFRSGFDATTIEKIQQCTDDSDPRCVASTEGGGWISAFFMGFAGGNQELPRRRNSLAIAEYTLIREPGPGGTLIRITDRLKRMGSPPVAINFTVNGKSRIPATVIDGFITGASLPEEGKFLRGDADGNSRLNVSDAIRIIRLAAGNLEEADCEDGLDTDDDGIVDLQDGMLLLRYVFERGTGLSLGMCGEDSTRDDLGCKVSSCKVERALGGR